MTDPTWTTPTHVIAHGASDSAKFNAETVDNLLYLHAAKAGRFTAGPGAANKLTWTSIQWDTALLETPNMWASSPYPERICPGIGGLWLVTLALSWPAGDYVGRIRLQKNGTDQVDSATVQVLGGYSTSSSLTALVELDGEGDYINAHLYHDHDPLVLFSDDRARLDIAYLGSV